MKGLLLEFIFLTLLADIVLLGFLWPLIKKRLNRHREVDIESARGTRRHLVTFWNDHGTGRGDDACGWRCSCGLFRVGDWGIEEHLEFVKKIDDANRKLNTDV